MYDTCPLVGKTITAVYLAKDRGALKFDIQGEEPIIARADGDCCSFTWIEEIDSPERLIGSPITFADGLVLNEGKNCHGEDYRYYDETLDNPYNNKETTKDTPGNYPGEINYEPECVRYYGFKIQTKNGDTVIDFRNESNGYYGGNLVWNQKDFYGGVYNQNVSEEQWEKIA